MAVSSGRFWSLLLKARGACALGDCSGVPVAAAGCPKEGGGLRKLVLGKLCQGTG